MKDSNGQEIKLGDRVKVWDNRFGRVGCSLDTDEFTDNYSKSDWNYLKKGILIKTDGGLLRCPRFA
jgi:hypothetical protein